MPFLRKKGLFESTRVLFLPVACLAPNPNQPRTRFTREGLEELAASIAEHGILQPLSVRRSGSTGYELISGERRLRAAHMAGLTEVPCIVVTATDTESSILALIENLQRRDLDFVEEAQALRSLLDNTGLSQEAAAQQLGKSQSAIANKLRLLKLSPETLRLLRSAGLTERHARALLRLEAPADQEAAAQHIIREGLTVAKAEDYVQSLLSPAPAKKQKPIIILKDVRLFLNTLTRGLSLMQDAGVKANCQRQDTEQEILLTIRIPNAAAPSASAKSSRSAP